MTKIKLRGQEVINFYSNPRNINVGDLVNGQLVIKADEETFDNPYGAGVKLAGGSFVRDIESVVPKAWLEQGKISIKK